MQPGTVDPIGSKDCPLSTCAGSPETVSIASGLKYRIRNWPQYDTGLRQRGDLTLWVDEAAIAGWSAPRRATPGGQARYSDLVIELALMLRLVFHLALRQAEGFVSSIFRLVELALPIPDHTTLSRRGRDFAYRQPRMVPHGPLHLLIDGTGLKLFGRGEWNSERHGRARRSWRKLHLAVDAETGEIIASVLTGNDAHDASQVPILLEQIEGEIESVLADGAYDGEPVYRAIQARQSEPAPTIIIPPRVCGAQRRVRCCPEPTRSPHPVHPGEWAFSLAEGDRPWSTQSRRDSGGPLQGTDRATAARPHTCHSTQQGEAVLGVEVLNRMIRITKPASVRII